MQPHRSSSGGNVNVVEQAWQALPDGLQRGLAVSLRVVLILVAARLLLRLVPALETMVVRRAALAATSTRREPTDSQQHSAQRTQTLVRVVGSVARAAVSGLAVVTLLSEVGLDVAPLLAGAGIAGVAVGFGAQSIVKDFFNGFFVLLENHYDVGDEVTVNTVRGTVEEMTMRVTVVRDLAGAVHYFSNGAITTVVNHTAGWLRATVSVTTPVSVAAPDARRVLDAVAADANADAKLAPSLTGAVTVEGPAELAAAGLTWKLQARARPRRVDLAREGIVAALQRRVPVDDKGALDWPAAVRKLDAG